MGLMSNDRQHDTPGRFDDAKLAAAFEQLPALLDADPNLIRRGAFFDARFAVVIGAIPFDVIVSAGRVSLFERGPFVMRSWRFSVRASAEAWGRLWQPVPEPGWHDLNALMKRGCATLEGDLHPLMANLQYVKDLLVLPRRIAGGRS
jgi:hypothetical protein